MVDLYVNNDIKKSLANGMRKTEFFQNNYRTILLRSAKSWKQGQLQSPKMIMNCPGMLAILFIPEATEGDKSEMYIRSGQLWL